MMKFEDKFSLPLEWISDETKLIVESCREIVEKEIMPVRHELDEDWKDHKIYTKILEKIMLDFGLQCAPWPKEYGGLESDLITACLCNEEMSRGDSGISTAAGCINWTFMPMLAPNPNPVLTLMQEADRMLKILMERMESILPQPLNLMVMNG
jgi:alkylation response protein AidB-like acyl-CoA dehydrogenase